MDLKLKKLITLNVKEIFNTSQQRFELTDFILQIENDFILPQELIQHMTELDLIEQEEDFFYLTEHGYDVAEGHTEFVGLETKDEYVSVFENENVKRLKFRSQQGFWLVVFFIILFLLVSSIVIYSTAK